MWCHPIADCVLAPYDASKKALIAQQNSRSNVIILCINNSLTTDVKFNLRANNTLYAYNSQDDGSAMFPVIVKMVLPYKHAR